MKKIILIAIAALVVILPGCKQPGGGNPKETLTHFFDALAKKDITEAKKYATEDSEAMMNMMAMGMQNMNNDHAGKMLEMMQHIEIKEAAIDGDIATVPVKDKKSGEVTDFILKKEKGDWKVAFDMSTLMKMANKKMKQHGMGNINMDSMQREMNKAMDSLNAATPAMKHKMEHDPNLADSLKNMHPKTDENIK